MKRQAQIGDLVFAADLDAVGEAPLGNFLCLAAKLFQRPEQVAREQEAGDRRAHQRQRQNAVEQVEIEHCLEQALAREGQGDGPVHRAVAAIGQRLADADRRVGDDGFAEQFGALVTADDAGEQTARHQRSERLDRLHAE